MATGQSVGEQLIAVTSRPRRIAILRSACPPKLPASATPVVASLASDQTTTENGRISDNHRTGVGRSTRPHRYRHRHVSCTARADIFLALPHSSTSHPRALLYPRPLRPQSPLSTTAMTKRSLRLKLDGFVTIQTALTAASKELGAPATLALADGEGVFLECQAGPFDALHPDHTRIVGADDVMWFASTTKLLTSICESLLGREGWGSTDWEGKREEKQGRPGKARLRSREGGGPIPLPSFSARILRSHKATCSSSTRASSPSTPICASTSRSSTLRRRRSSRTLMTRESPSWKRTTRPSPSSSS